MAGTHGKTTTSSILAWILEHAGLEPGFLIGGVPGQLLRRARASAARTFFVIEADEYDTAFFDKRAKFVHYRPRTLILNNLEFDHADIYADLGAIQKQFHHLVRTVPALGPHPVECRRCRISRRRSRWALDAARRLRARRPAAASTWSLDQPEGGDFSRFEVLEAGRPVGTVQLGLVRRAQRGERAGGDRRRAARGRAGGAGDRGAGRVQGRQAAHGTARRSARHRGVRRFRASPHRHSRRPSTDCAARWAASASSRCSSRARPP